MINSTLTYRYAHAFFNVFQAQFTLESMHAFTQATSYLKKHQASIHLLHLAHISLSDKEKALTHVVTQLGIDPLVIRPLIKTLLTDKRIYLFIPILEQIPGLYYKHNSVEHFTLSSPQPLSTAQEVFIKEFLAQATGKKIILNSVIDRSLIAGLRILSDNVYFEKSVRACLEKLRTNQL